jgi:hypothetical protein
MITKTPLKIISNLKDKIKKYTQPFNENFQKPDRCEICGEYNCFVKSVLGRIICIILAELFGSGHFARIYLSLLFALLFALNIATNVIEYTW